MTTLKEQLNAGINVNSFGRYTAIAVSVLAFVTFGIAFFSPPVSGPFCKANCLEYPYSEITSRFPRDYIWMYPAMILNVAIVLLMASIHQITSNKRKLFSRLGFSFALIACSVLIIDYFVQLSVIPPSLVNDEADGIALLTQFNPHGIFIALEEIGYILMSISFLCLVPAFPKTNRLARAIRRVYILNFALMVSSLIAFTIIFGIHREYLFEVAIITINFITLIVSGILLGVFFRNELKSDSIIETNTGNGMIPM